jgi:hypothetical protein
MLIGFRVVVRRKFVRRGRVRVVRMLMKDGVVLVIKMPLNRN